MWKRFLHGKRGKKQAPLQSESSEWSGNFAEAAELEFYLSASSVLSREDLLSLPGDVQGLISGMYQMVREAVRAKNHRQLMSAFRFARGHVLSRAQQNRLAIMTVTEHQKAKQDERAAFYKEAHKLFDSKHFISHEGEQIISTRSGGGWWYLGQGLLVVFNPQQKTTEIKEKGSGGSTVVIKQTKLRVDTNLFDDFIQLTPDGVVIHNPSRGSDRYVVEWSQASSLIISTNASAYIDPVNRWIRPMFKGWAQSPWVPFGTLTIVDRQSGTTLVTALMGNPDAFRVKLQKLIKAMQPHAVSSERVDPVAPIDLQMMIGTFDGPIREEMQELLQRARRKVGRVVLPPPGKRERGATMYTFHGEVLDDEAMKKSIEKALQEIRAQHPELHPEKMQALKDLAAKMEPFAGEPLKSALRKIARMK